MFCETLNILIKNIYVCTMYIYYIVYIVHLMFIQHNAIIANSIRLNKQTTVYLIWFISLYQPIIGLNYIRMFRGSITFTLCI